MWVIERPPTMGFVLNTINLECMCDTSYITWKNEKTEIFARIIIPNFKKKIPGAM